MRREKEEAGLKARRRAAMAVIAATSGEALSAVWSDADLTAQADVLRGPEAGLVTVRGRIGGGGAPFNVGEATVTRATVRLSSGEVGHAYLLGRDNEKARLAAIVDALLQRPEEADAVEARVVEPLRILHEEAKARRRAETAATKVDFFTVARGED